METFETTAKDLTALEEPTRREALEFIVNDDFVKQLPKILSNIEEIKAEIVERTETDRNLILQSDEDFDRARKRCAELNKVNEAIDKKRKEVKKQYNEPYEKFEKALKDTMAVITAAKDNLWGQITSAEETVKKRKEEQYKAYWHDKGALAEHYRTWEQIFNKSWLNKGYTAEKVCKEIDDIIADIGSDVDSIDALNSEFAPALFDKYKSGATLKDVIAYNIALIDAKKREDVRKALERASTAKNEETRTESEITQNRGIEDETPAEDDPIRTVDFRVVCRKSQLVGLSNYMHMNGIKYGRVPTNE